MSMKPLLQKPIVRSELESIRLRLRAFAKEREWDKFHTPKNLSIALVVEASELAEHFQWLTGSESKALKKRALREVEAEIADVFLYLIRIADKLGVDVIEAAERKMKVNRVKYPATRVRGSAKKYSEYK
jgi:dCTP diphosphatase